jgi:hypothetical protein
MLECADIYRATGSVAKLLYNFFMAEASLCLPITEQYLGHTNYAKVTCSRVFGPTPKSYGAVRACFSSKNVKGPHNCGALFIF